MSHNLPFIYLYEYNFGKCENVSIIPELQCTFTKSTFPHKLVKYCKWKFDNILYITILQLLCINAVYY